jgi:UDP-N-acetylmuramoyl-L-alanyl-D-glutamate--2,6-diaminopimelate ligase
VILLAGKGHETYQEINGKKIHLDEREEIQDFFRGT